MDRKVEELLKNANRRENFSKHQISKNEMLEIIKSENLDGFGITIRI